MVEAWPFVGRDEQLRFIAAAYRDASVSGVVVVGDAGFGKTRLAREAMARLAAPGRRIEWVTATRSAAVIPLGAVSQLLPPGCPDDGGLAAFLHAVRHFAADGGRRMVLAVDDAHLPHHSSWPAPAGAAWRGPPSSLGARLLPRMRTVVLVLTDCPPGHAPTRSEDP